MVFQECTIQEADSFTTFGCSEPGAPGFGVSRKNNQVIRSGIILSDTDRRAGGGLIPVMCQGEAGSVGDISYGTHSTLLVVVGWNRRDTVAASDTEYSHSAFTGELFGAFFVKVVGGSVFLAINENCHLEFVAFFAFILGHHLILYAMTIFLAPLE